MALELDPSLPEKAQRFRAGLKKAARALDNSETRLARILKNSIKRWNRAISYDCADSLLEAVMSANQGNDSEPWLKAKGELDNSRRDLKSNYFSDKTPVKELNSKFLQTWNHAVRSGFPLTGDNADRVPMNKPLMEKIEAHPEEMLIGDWSVGMYLFHPEVYDAQRGDMNYDGRFTKFNPNPDSSTLAIRGVNDVDRLASLLESAAVGRSAGREPGMNRDRLR